VYVLEGTFVVDVEGGDRVSIGPGEVYHEAVNRNMVARNGSPVQPVTVLLFQVSNRGEPRVIISK
jgi:quercetin dioxygenase-like cupin family protein